MNRSGTPAAQVRAKAFRRAATALGLPDQVVAAVARLQDGDLKLVRLYVALRALVGNDGDMQHWMRTGNSGTGGVPSEQVRSEDGMLAVLEYLEGLSSRCGL